MTDQSDACAQIALRTERPFPNGNPAMSQPPQSPVEDQPATENLADDATSSTVDAADTDSSIARREEPAAALPESARRVLKVPVKVVVYLAEKKIAMGQLLTICPGALVTFSKSCEDSLDLYVNNHRYCRGEAVKIGEKFGLKISEVGVVDVRESPILV